MGKQQQSTTIEMTTKPTKRKGRPPKNPNSTPNIRSTRRKPNYSNSPQLDDDEDEREQKKVKLVGKLPEFEETNQLKQNYESGSGSELGPKKLRNDSIGDGSDDGVSIKVKEEKKRTESQVNVLENGPTITTPLPDKKLLFFILDRLQKKDTYGVFSEAVDPDELPDYFEIIDQPMDFGTLRNKLDSGDYRNLEELEADISLICSNAMQYNDSDTVYYRQARSIQELANRDFQNLRNEGEDGEPQPKVVRRGRPPGSKSLKKAIETLPADNVNNPRVVPELSSRSTLFSEEEKAMRSTSYNLRKTPMPRFRSSDPFFSSYMSRNGEQDWNNEFPAKILRADMKYGSKHYMMDENRRHTYKQISQSSGSTPLFSDFNGAKRLVMVGLQEPLAYGRSLARYAATLGPVAWKMASNRIQSTLPANTKYGPGWVGDNGPPSQPSSFSNMKHQSSNSNTQHLASPISDPSFSATVRPTEGIVEAVCKLSSQNDQKPVCQSQANSFVGLFGNSSLAQQRFSPSDPPDLNLRVLPSSSSLQIGSPQQPELALQL